MANYTEDFKIKVRECFGNQFDEMLSSGNVFLGRFLDDSSTGGISVDKILLATDQESLQNEAMLLKKKKNLYNEYWDQPGIKN